MSDFKASVVEKTKVELRAMFKKLGVSVTDEFMCESAEALATEIGDAVVEKTAENIRADIDLSTSSSYGTNSDLDWYSGMNSAYGSTFDYTTLDSL